MKLQTFPLAVIVAITALFGVWLTSAASADPAGLCGHYINSAGHRVPRPCGNWRDNARSPPPTATARCQDGTWSSSEHPHDPRTCSYHGGAVGYR